MDAQRVDAEALQVSVRMGWLTLGQFWFSPTS